MERVNSLLAAGIAAARAGNKDEAQNLLLQVTELDETNETAWLWLSGVVDSDADRRICLENVLAINPANQAAQRGLASLGPVEPAPAAVEPPAPVEDEAANRRHPEAPAVEETLYQAYSGYDDIWSQDVDICAYCAHKVAYEDNSCKNCGQSLLGSQFRYPRPSSDMYVYFVLLLGASQLYFIKLLIDLIIQSSVVDMLLHGLLFVVLAAFAGGVYFRQFFVYAASLIFLSLTAMLMIVDWLTGQTVSSTVGQLFTAEQLLSLTANPYAPLARGVGAFLGPFGTLTIFLALLYGVFRVSPDFERVKERYVAQVDKGLREADHFYAAGRTYAERGMWANAVLHWQRAAANEPNRPFYQRSLAQAYARLGFLQRSLDTLRHARRISGSPETIAAMDRQIAALERQLAESPT